MKTKRVISILALLLAALLLFAACGEKSRALAILYGRPFLSFGREPGVAPPRIGSGRCVKSLLLRAFGFFFYLRKLPAPPHPALRATFPSRGRLGTRCASFFSLCKNGLSFEKQKRARKSPEKASTLI